MSKTSEIEVVDVGEVEEVAAFLHAEEELHQHIQSNPEYYAKLQQLVTTRNEILEDAEKRVRELNVTCGPIVKISETKKIDIEKLFEELGDADFKAVGGYTETIVDYKLDRPRFLSYAKSGTVPAEILESCVKDTASYTVPKPYKLP